MAGDWAVKAVGRPRVGLQFTGRDEHGNYVFQAEYPTPDPANRTFYFAGSDEDPAVQLATLRRSSATR